MLLALEAGFDPCSDSALLGRSLSIHHVLRRPVSVTGIIDMYIDAKRLSRRPTSVADAVRAVKTASPRCGLTDEDLRADIALRAIASRRDAAFRSASSARTTRRSVGRTEARRPCGRRAPRAARRYSRGTGASHLAAWCGPRFLASPLFRRILRRRGRDIRCERDCSPMPPNSNLAPVTADAINVVSICIGECDDNVISTCEIIAKVRVRAPHVQLSDEELVALIVEIAGRWGRSVQFRRPPFILGNDFRPWPVAGGISMADEDEDGVVAAWLGMRRWCDFSSESRRDHQSPSI